VPMTMTNSLPRRLVPLFLLGSVVFAWCVSLAGCRDASAQLPPRDPLPAGPARVADALPVASPRRLSVMFFGAPTANGPHHDPITRYRVIKKALGVSGVDFTYVEDPEAAFSPAMLSQFDAVLM